MQVAVIGAGAVGLGLGSFALAAGDRIVFVARDPKTRAALEASGLLRKGIFGRVQHSAEAIEVAASIDALRARALDCILVCTKSTASAEVARALASVWSSFPSPPAVVLCQNGWGNAEIFAEHLPRGRVFNARVITGFRKSSPAEVEITVHAEPVRIGSLFDPRAAEADTRVSALAEHIASSGLPCELTRDIAKDLLAKLLYNCALNPLGAILGVPYGELGRGAKTRALIEAVVREIFDVLEASELSTHWNSADEYLADFYSKLLPPTATHESSMLQDLRAGRSTEIDAISGAVLRLAEAGRIDVPVSGALRVLVVAIENAVTRRA